MAREEPHDALDYRAILEQVPAIVYIAETGEDGAWLYVNEWIEPILGYTVEEWMRKPGWIHHLHPDDREVVLVEEHRVAEGDDPDTFYQEYRLLHKDGRSVWIQDNSTLIPDVDGTLHWYGVLQDITKQKAAEAELERQSAAQAAVAQLGEHALERIPIDDLLREACDSVTRVLEIESAIVVELSPNQDSMELCASVGWGYARPGQRTFAIARDTQVGSALWTGRPAVVSDWETQTSFARSQALDDHGLQSGVAVRVKGEFDPWGCFAAFSTHKRSYSPPDVAFIQSLANVLADAIERREREDEIEHRSLHDALTALPNRTLFNDRLEHAIERLYRRGSAAAALVFVDLDNFKQVNDTLGHKAGDELLVGVAQRLREAVRPTDTVARLSGDEFVVLVEEISSERDAIATAERIAAGFARPFALEAASHFVTASLGIALADGFTSAQELLENADNAMYRAKERGRARYEVFDEDMRVRAIARMRIENDLTRALDLGELSLVYQPLVLLHDQTILGVETLLRWNHPHRGPISPAEFIPVAEDSGLIDRIGRWVLEEAFREARDWAQLRPDSPPLRVAVNVSPQQLQNQRFAEMVAEILAATGVSPDSIVIEISETVLSESAEPSRETLRQLCETGLRLSIDDFGTGQASLRALTELPVGAIKVDGSFVAKLGTNEPGYNIAHATIAMATALGLRTIAEGVETVEQARSLKGLGCLAAQGNLYHEPVSAGAITGLLQEGTRIERF
jgi:diguanylate cyclase (GGDEF)-like protein/PAS domain S-box-containing protein